MARKLKISAVFHGIDKITRPIKKVGKSIAKMTRGAKRGLRGVNKVADKFTKGLKKGVQAATVAMVGLGVAVAKVVTVGADFEKNLVRAAVKMPGDVRKGTAAYTKLETAVRKVGEVTEFTASQAAEGADLLAMAGFDLEQTMAALPKVVNLATATNKDFAEVTEIAVKSLGAFGLRTDDSIQLGKNLSKVNDLLAKTSTGYAVSVDSLFESIKTGAKVALDSNQTMHTFMATMGHFANNSIEGEKAGTAFRNMMLRLQAPVGAAKGLIKKYIGSLDNGKGSMIDFVEVIQRMEKGLEGVGSIKRAGIMDKIFGKKAITAAVTSLKIGSKKLEESRDALMNIEGAGKNMAATIRDTVSGSIDTLKSSLESVIIDLFKLQDGGIKRVVDMTTKWVRANKKVITSGIGDFINKIIDNFDRLVETIKTVGIVVGIILGIIGVLKVLTGVLTLVNLVAAANPITLIILGIVAVVAVAATLIAVYWDDIAAAFKVAWEWIKSVAETVGDALISAWDGVKSFFVSLWDGIVSIFEKAVNLLIYNGPISWIIAGIMLVKENWEPIAGFFKWWWGVVVGFAEGAVSYLINNGPIAWIIAGVNLIRDNWEPIAGFFKWWWGVVVGFAEKAVGYLINNGPLSWVIAAANLIIDNWEPISGFFSNLWDGIVGTFREGIAIIKSIFSPVIALIDKVVAAKDRLLGRNIGKIDLGVDTNVSQNKVGRIDFGVNKGADRSEEARNFTPQVVNQQERVLRSFDEKMSMSVQKSEVTIRDETGRAKVTSGDLGAGLFFEQAGSF